jgi:hypothetical protein
MGDWNSGNDAAYIKPKFVPEDGLHAPDFSGPPTMERVSGEFGVSHRNTKGYLSTGKGD